MRRSRGLIALLAAANYLRSIAGEFGEPARPHVLMAAGHYDQLQAKLCPQRALVPFPWDIRPDKPWTADMRRRQSDLLKEAFAMEPSAVAEIKAALAAEGISTTAGRQ